MKLCFARQVRLCQCSCCYLRALYHVHIFSCDSCVFNANSMLNVSYVCVLRSCLMCVFNACVGLTCETCGKAENRTVLIRSRRDSLAGRIIRIGKKVWEMRAYML